jgi:hypothetical protein
LVFGVFLMKRNCENAMARRGKGRPDAKQLPGKLAETGGAQKVAGHGFLLKCLNSPSE